MVFFNAEDEQRQYGRAALADYLAGYEGRLMRSLKSLLGTSLIDGQTEVAGARCRSASCWRNSSASSSAAPSGRRPTTSTAPCSAARCIFIDDNADADQLAEDTLAEIARAAGFKRHRLPVRADRRRLRLRIAHRARGTGADRRHRRRHLGLFAGAPVAASGPAQPTGATTSSPPAACTSAAPISTNT